ncbi:MAG: FAD-dependent oxidoreductase [Hyphomicrobiaceae bacterium]
MPQQQPPIVIVGAGIGGLALALALCHRGIASVVLEARESPDVAGAGIQLGPNATRVLAELGVAEGLAAHVSIPEALVVRSGATARTLATLPLGSWIAQRHGSPYWVLHRRDLHSALLDAAQRAGIEVRYDCRVTGWHQSKADRLVVEIADCRDLAADCIVGADGLWSSVRRNLHPDHLKAYSGQCAVRAVIARRVVPEPLNGAAVGVWFSPSGHLVHYPVSGGREVAIVLVTKREEPGHGWGHPLSSEAVAQTLAEVAPALPVEFVHDADWRQWALFNPPALESFHSGRIALLGDAAHPILPFLAQGGALALEDAVVLAHQLTDMGSPIEKRLLAYSKSRVARCREVQSAARANGRIYHLAWPASAARDAVLRAAPPQQLMSRYDWLYGWKPPSP